MTPPWHTIATCCTPSRTDSARMPSTMVTTRWRNSALPSENGETSHLRSRQNRSWTPSQIDRRQHVLERDAVRHVAIGLHLAQFRVHDGLETCWPSATCRAVSLRPLQMAARDGVDLLVASAAPTVAACRWPSSDSGASVHKAGVNVAPRHLLLAVPHERDREDVRLVRQERPVERGRRRRRCRRLAWRRRSRRRRGMRVRLHAARWYAIRSLRGGGLRTRVLPVVTRMLGRWPSFVR